MATFGTRPDRDGGVLTLIHLFGLSYTLLFLIHFLTYYFPRSPEDIPNALAVLFYAGGFIFWCMSSLVCRTISIFQGDQALTWQKVEWTGALGYIYTTSTTFVLLQFSDSPYIQVAYLSVLSVVAVGSLLEASNLGPDDRVCHQAFRSRSILFGMVALVPAVHVLSQTLPNPPTLVIDLFQLSMLNVFGALCSTFALPERLGLVGHWRPSFYAMHLILALSNVVYSKRILATLA
ncbi:hypothetical protein BBP40_002146 [Aspergillus hancockii]|nr:hypothetical protein BBP40_002146 [Aspergillus hancockii]